MSHHTSLSPRRASLVAVLSLATVFSVAASAQAPAGPSRPPVIFAMREAVKQGHDAMHLRHETDWMAALHRVGVKAPTLGMVSSSGVSEVWWLVAAPSHAAMETQLAAFFGGPAAAVTEKFAVADAAHIDGVRTMTLSLRPDLSLGVPADMALARGMEVTTWRIRPGHDPQFVQATQLYDSLAKRAAVPIAVATYEVAAGGMWGSYISFVAVKSAADFDRMQADAQKIFGGAPVEAMARMNTFLKESVISAETNRFVFDPNISSPPEDFVARDAAFWTPSWKKAGARASTRR